MGRAPDPQPVLVDPRYFDNRKLRAVGAHGRELHLRMICYSNLNLTDGVLTHEEAEELAGRVLDQGSGSLVPHTMEERIVLLDTLVAARLLEVCSVGYAIHDYDEHQLTRAEIMVETLSEIEADQDADRRRGLARIRKRRQRERDSHAEVTRDPVTATAVQSVSSLSATAQDTGELHGEQNGKPTWGSVHGLLADSDDRTPIVIAAMRRRYGLPDAALHNAVEALEERRARTPALVSEARYFVATLRGLAESGQYEGAVA